MQFLLIMGIGTLVAIWVVANQPKPRGRRRRPEPEIISFEHLSANKPAYGGGLGEVCSTDEMDYMKKMARHQDDPQHWPPPLPPPPPKKTEFEHN